MSPVYHILGADIAHHNATLLRFLDQQLAPFSPQKIECWVVSSNANLAEQYPHLTLRVFKNKKQIAWAIFNAAKNKQAKWFFHGQYNVWIWLMILFKRLPNTHIHWHIWGADLYEVSHHWQFKFFYPLRRLAQKNISNIFATQGDLNYLQRSLNHPNLRPQRLYFPTKMADISFLQNIPKKEPLVILVGNSGDPSNRHIEALAHIKKQFGNQVYIVLPMGYPAHNSTYIQQVKCEAERLFPAQHIQLFTENLPFEAYILQLQQCHCAYFLFERQQGIGTFCLLTQLNIPVILSDKNPFIADLAAQHIPFLFPDKVNKQDIQQTAQQLAQLNKNEIAFFAPKYSEQWQRLIQQLYT